MPALKRQAALRTPAKYMALATPKVLAALAALSATAAIGLASSPAAAADDVVDVNISRLSSEIAAGRSDAFTVRMTNQTKNKLTGVSRVVLVLMPGLTPAQVQVARGRTPLAGFQTEPGLVRFHDPLLINFAPGDSEQAPYVIGFAATTPSGDAKVVVEARQGQNVLGSDSDTVNIKGGVAVPATPSPTASPAPSTSSGPTATAGTDSPSAAPLDGSALTGASPGGGAPVLLYLMGAVLVAVGGAIIWLLLRTRPVAATAPHPAGPYPSAPLRAEGPPLPRRLNPTRIMPTLGSESGRGGPQAWGGHPTTPLPGAGPDGPGGKPGLPPHGR